MTRLLLSTTPKSENMMKKITATVLLAVAFALMATVASAGSITPKSFDGVYRVDVNGSLKITPADCVQSTSDKPTTLHHEVAKSFVANGTFFVASTAVKLGGNVEPPAFVPIVHNGFWVARFSKKYTAGVKGDVATVSGRFTFDHSSWNSFLGTIHYSETWTDYGGPGATLQTCHAGGAWALSGTTARA